MNFSVHTAGEGNLARGKVFVSARVGRRFYGDGKFLYNYEIFGRFVDTNDKFAIVGEMRESSWCRATIEPDMPTELKVIFFVWFFLKLTEQKLKT